MSTRDKSGGAHANIVCGVGSWRQLQCRPQGSGQEGTGAHSAEVWAAVSARDVYTVTDMDGSLKHKMKGVRNQWGEFPGSPGVRTRCFHCWGLGSIPGHQGTKIPLASRLGQKKKKRKKKPVEVLWHNTIYVNSKCIQTVVT